MTPRHLLGGAIALAGLVLAAAPSLVSDPAPGLDLFETIERRIPWGGLAGIGALIVAREGLRPWSVTLAAAAVWVVLGILVARLLGLALDGADSPRQWLWVAVEVAVLVVAALILRWRQRVAARASDEGAPAAEG